MGALPRRSAGPRPEARSGIRRILLATDLSAASAAATSQALDLADDLRADLVILSVIEPVARLPGGLVRRVDQIRGAREAAAQEIVEQGRGRGVSVEFLVWQGEPAEAIVEAAYLVATADGVLDDTEREAFVQVVIEACGGAVDESTPEL